MQLLVDLSFEQIVFAARMLSDAQWNELKQEVEQSRLQNTPAKSSEMVAFLLGAPTFTKKQLKAIAKIGSKS